jgi:hypothetical protein
MPCTPCQQLDIKTLIELAQKEPRTGKFPVQSYYTHHATIRNLVASAEDGCGLCKLLVQALDSVPIIGAPDASHMFYATMLRHAKSISRFKATDIRLAIDAVHAPWDREFSDVEMLDLIQIRVGDDTMGSYMPQLIISTPRSMHGRPHNSICMPELNADEG